MEFSIFLARLLGLFLGIMFIAFLTKPILIKTISKEVEKASAVYYIAAIFTLLFGTILILSHSVWVCSWPLVITILGWCIFINALIRLFFPQATQTMFHWWLKHYNYLRIVFVIGLLLSLYLLYYGFIN